MKWCPRCNQHKPLTAFDTYWAKTRNKHRLQPYCKECFKQSARERAAAHYERNKEKKIAYNREYRKDPAKKEKVHEANRKRLKARRDAATDSIIVGYLNRTTKAPAAVIRQHPELIENFRSYLLLTRAIKTKQREQQNNRRAESPYSSNGAAKR